MALMCKICAALNGITSVGTHQLELTEEQLYKHIEDVHHIAVQRDGETKEEAAQRFVAAHPNAWPNKNCSCPACQTTRRTQLALNSMQN